MEDIREEEDLWGIVYVRSEVSEPVDMISTGWSDSEEEREQNEN